MLALDDVNVLDRRCETTYFFINEYAQVLNTTAKGNYLWSNFLFNEDGYAFKIAVSGSLMLFCGCKRLLFYENFTTEQQV